MAFFGPSYTDQQKQQLALLQGQGGAQFGNVSNLYSGISGGYNSILANPGYTPGQVSNLFSSTLQPISGAFGSAAGGLQRTAGATRNNAGLYSGAAGLAQKAAQAMGPAASKTAFDVSNYGRDQQFKALSGMQNLYNPTLTAGTSLYDAGSSVANNPASPSVFSDILGAAGAAGGIMTGLGSMGMKPFAPPARAHGGKVKKNRPYIVGERGPEVFTPERSGRVIPNLYAA